MLLGYVFSVFSLHTLIFSSNIVFVASIITLEFNFFFRYLLNFSFLVSDGLRVYNLCWSGLHEPFLSLKFSQFGDQNKLYFYCTVFELKPNFSRPSKLHFTLTGCMSTNLFFLFSFQFFSFATEIRAGTRRVISGFQCFCYIILIVQFVFLLINNQLIFFSPFYV